MHIIDALGGATTVAEAISRQTGNVITRAAVSNWRRRGISWRYRAALAAIAEDNGIVVPAAFRLGRTDDVDVPDDVR